MGGQSVSISSLPSTQSVILEFGWSSMSSTDMEYLHHSWWVVTITIGGWSKDTARALRLRPSSSLLLLNLLFLKLLEREPFSLLRREDERCGWWRELFCMRRLGRLAWWTDSALVLLIKPMLPTVNQIIINKPNNIFHFQCDHAMNRKLCKRCLRYTATRIKFAH